MAASSPASALIEAYLDPSRSWDADQDKALRDRLRADRAASDRYDRAVVLHRLAWAGSTEEMTGFERRRHMEVLLGAVTGAAPAEAGPNRAPRWWAAIVRHGRGLTALSAAVALGLALLLLHPPTSNDPTLTPRGVGDVERPRAAIGISGVTEDMREYEVIASGQAAHGDWFRFYYTSEDPGLTSLFVLGVQPTQPLIWYAPLPPDETASLAISPGRQVKLPFENHLAARHVAGPLRVVAIFSAAPVTVERVRAALDPARLATSTPTELQDAVRRSLSLAPDDVVQLLETTVVDPPPKEAPDVP